MPAAKMTVEEVLNFTEELSDRFPDYSDREILESVSEYWTDSGEVINEDSILGRAVLHAYNFDAESALVMWFSRV